MGIFTNSICYFQSRSKVDDPDHIAIKARAKEMQRLEMEEIRQREANQTALQAIGFPKKRLKTSLGASVAAGGSSGLNGLGGISSFSSNTGGSSSSGGGDNLVASGGSGSSGSNSLISGGLSGGAGGSNCIGFQLNVSNSNNLFSSTSKPVSFF